MLSRVGRNEPTGERDHGEFTASCSQAGPPMSVCDIYANARGLAAYLEENSAAIDEARRASFTTSSDGA
jgi:hypothetical protein